MENKKYTLDISYEGIMRLIVVFALFLVVYFLRDILFILFISILLALIIDPAVDSIEKKKIPRVIAAFMLFSFMFLVLGSLIYIIATPLAKELSELALRIPNYLGSSIFLNDKSILNTEISGPLQSVLLEASSYFKNIASGLFSGIFNILGGFVSAILILVITFYLIIEENGVVNFVKQTVPQNLQPRSLRIIKKVQTKLGRWFVGQLALGFIVGTMSLIGLYLLGVPYSLVLAIIAGILELIPYIGPILSAIPAIIIALTVSPELAFLTLILYFLIQQFENYLIVPKVMEKSVNLHPIVIIVVVIMGQKIAGVTGAIIAVPVATIAAIIIEDILSKKDATI